MRARSQTRLQLFVRHALADERLGAEDDGECEPFGVLGAGFGGVDRSPSSWRMKERGAVELLACGHAAHVGGKLDKAWLIRGVGVEYDLCCAACL